MYSQGIYIGPMDTKNFVHRDKRKNRYVKALLVLYGIKQETLAKELGVSDAFLSEIISGKRRACKKTGKHIRQGIAKALGIPISDLWPEE